MAEKRSEKFKLKERALKHESPPDRYPTNAELLADLSQPGLKRTKPRKPPVVSRRTRDFLLVVCFSSGCLVFMLVQFMSPADAKTIVRLSLTGIGVISALLWYIFYGVMSRY